MTIHPYRIHVEQAILDDLLTRVERAQRSPDFRAMGWKYGTDPQYLDGLLE